MGSTFYYFCFIYIPVFLKQYSQFPLGQTALLMTFLLAFMLIMVPLSGWLCDRIGRRKMLLFNAAFIILISIPGVYLVEEGHFFVTAIVLFIFTIASSLEQAVTSVTVVENYPVPARYTGLSVSYNIGNGFFGGTVPLVCGWLITQFHVALAPAIYVVLCAVLTGLVALFL